MILENNIYKFSSFPQTVIQAISTKYYGSIKDKKEFHKGNLKRFADSMGIYSDDIIFSDQRHTGNVEVIQPHPRPLLKGEGVTQQKVFDGLVTKESGIFLGIVTADCLPIMFYDSTEKIVGIAHAGYKGILNKILENMISAFVKLGSNVKNIAVGIGPGIGACCYCVTIERIKRFLNIYPECKNVYKMKGNKFFLDLVTIAEYALTNMGINLSQIEKANICTMHNLNEFYSYRGDSNDTFGEFASLIGLK